MAREKLKKPEDYEIFSFRTTKDQKNKLNSLVERVVDIYNEKKGDDEKVYRKNDIIMKALNKGLALMKRSPSAKKSNFR